MNRGAWGPTVHRVTKSRAQLSNFTLQSSSHEMLGCMNHKLESRLPGEISITSDMQMIPPLTAESKEELKNLVMKVKEESEKAG